MDLFLAAVLLCPLGPQDAGGPDPGPLRHGSGPGNPPLTAEGTSRVVEGWQTRGLTALADRDGDGWEDVLLTLVSEPDSVIPRTRTSLRLLSGATLEELSHADAPGELEIERGQDQGWRCRQAFPTGGRPARVFVVASLESSPRWSLEGTDSPVGGPYAASCVGDLDGDGFEEVAVANAWAVRSEGGEEIPCGAVAVLSGKDGRTLWTCRGTEDQGGFGMALAPAGDRDGDGVGEIAVLARPLLGDGRSRIEFLSGATGTPLPGSRSTGSFRGFELESLGDLDGDGLPELRVGEVVLSSGEGTPLDVTLGGRLAWCVPVQDLDADGLSDLLVGRVERGTARRHVSLYAAAGLRDLAEVDATAPPWTDPAGAVVRSIPTGSWTLLLADGGRIEVLHRGKVSEPNREHWQQKEVGTSVERVVIARRPARTEDAPPSAMAW